MISKYLTSFVRNSGIYPLPPKGKDEDEIRYGVVGYGVAGRAHSLITDRFTSARLCAICDTDVSKKELAYSNHPSVNFYDSIEDMLLSEELHVVSICTPHNTHCELSIAAMNSGIHVLCEKPMATNLDDASLMLSASQNNNVNLSVISQFRFERAPAFLKREIDEGSLGEILSTSIRVKWKKGTRYYRDKWKGRKEDAGGGVLINQAIHMIDLASWYNGGIYSVRTLSKSSREYIDVEDNAVSVVRFSNGSFGTLDTTTSANPHLGTTIEVVGTRYSVALSERKVQVWGGWGKVNTLLFGTRILLENLLLYDGSYFGYGHFFQIEDMARCIREGRQPAISGEDGRNTLKAVLAMMESVENNDEVFL